MRVLKNLVASIEEGKKKSIYYYRVVRGIKQGVQAYGIEAERIDYINGELSNIERDSIEAISPQLHKVYELLNLLHSNLVSPIHLVEILGDYVDEYITDFDRYYDEIATN